MADNGGNKMAQNENKMAERENKMETTQTMVNTVNQLFQHVCPVQMVLHAQECVQHEQLTHGVSDVYHLGGRDCGRGDGVKLADISELVLERVNG